MDSEENQKRVFHAAHRPWKSQLRFPHSRSSGGGRHGKVEIQNQDSHFPTALESLF